MDTGLVQIVVAIIGAVSPVAQELIQRGKSNGEFIARPDESLEQGVSAHQSASNTQRTRSFLDLAIILLYAAFFSIIISDSLLVSGRVPTSEISILFKICFVAFITTTSLVLSWYWNRGEAAVGILSLTTLLVLILSPGGPIRPVTDQGVEPGLSLILPVFALSTLATASLIYLFGNPLSKNTMPRSRKKIIFVLSGLLLVGTLSLGQQFVLNVSENPKSPSFSGTPEEKKNASELLTAIQTRNLEERGILYKLGSEIALSEYYKEAYFQVLSSIDFSNINRLDDRRGLKEKINSTAQASSTGDRQTEEQSEQQGASVQEELDEANRVKVLKAIANSFSNNPFRQLSYLADRLRWIHPTVLTGNSQLDLSLPGTDAETRLTNLSDYRIFHAISQQQNLINNFFSFFSYNRDIVEAFEVFPNKTEGLLRGLYGQREESKFDKVDSQTWSTLFPSLSRSGYKNLLQQQLAFPLQDELFIAYSTYINAAPAFDEEVIQEAASEFGTLASEAQRAFVKYVTDEESNLNNYRVFVKLAKSLNVEVIPDIGDSVTAALDLATEMEENQQLPNVSNLERSGTEELAILINQAFRDDPNSKEILLNILRMEEPQLPVKSLLSQDSFSFIKLIDSSLTDDHKIRLFGLLRDPIVPVIRQISRNVSPYKEFEWLQEQIDIFSELTIDNREAILQHLAISTYRADGEYSLDPIRLLIFQARSLNYWVAFLCSTILMLPIGIISILLGSLLGRSLVEKDRIQDLVIIEKAGQQDYTSTHNIGIPVDLQGREALIQRLQKLSGRGWSTIAVVGRRGIGKSRVLYEIYKNKSSEMTGFGVSAWISSPSQYTEDEFIESTLEQLALNTEQSIAYYLGAEPFSVRKLKALVTKSGLTVFFVSVCFLVLLLVVIYLRLQRPEVMITWSPILVIISASFFCLVRHLSQAQPVDLSPWLESDRMFSPHTVLLYRSVQQVFDYIDFRKEHLVIRNKNSAPLSRIISSAIAGFPIAFSATIIISAWPPYGQYAGFVFVFSWVLSSIFFYKLIGRDKRSGRGSNLMALVSTYREFASTVVYRLDQGALGKTGKDSVMICIDELDKIIDLNSLRDFLRRMKGIFEVPGVYYYLSLSEDALSALYLGTAEGKNEVDSSLDHIVRISPLPWKKSHELAVAYLQRRGFSEIDSSVSSALASASFGIPRDILRRVDEFLARKDYTSESSSSAIAEIRREQSELTIESYSWPRGWYEKISKEPIASSKNLEKIIKGIDTNEDAVGERGVRSLVLVWVLCMIEISMEFPSSERDSFLKTLHDFGYQISRIPLSDLFLAIEDLKAQFKSSMHLNGSV